jgi:hypothetical protein
MRKWLNDKKSALSVTISTKVKKEFEENKEKEQIVKEMEEKKEESKVAKKGPEDDEEVFQIDTTSK